MRITTHNLFSNLMIDGSIKAVPVVGMGATLCYYTDRHAATVIEVWEKNGKAFVKVQQDTATRTDNYGMSDMQDYEYTRNPNGRIHTYRFNQKKLIWDRVVVNPDTGRYQKSESPHLALGRRNEYYDYSF